MREAVFSVKDIHVPRILAAEKDFLVVYKPPGMHSSPIKTSGKETILDWCSSQYPETAGLPGRTEGEGGLLHRLDFETQGLMLLARTVSGMEALLARQTEGRIVKEYSAIALSDREEHPEGNLVRPLVSSQTGFPKETPMPTGFPFTIASAFRPYGPGRKSVRPVVDIHSSKNKDIAFDRGGPYITEILETFSLQSGFVSFRLRIFKGFRHQIRSHLAWLGTPILNDSLYGGAAHGKGFLALRACSLLFNDPLSGEDLSYSIPQLAPEDN